MCLAVPVKITEILDNGKTGRVDFGGVTQTISLVLLDNIQPGDYVLIHAGFAITKLDEGDAIKNLQTLKELITSYETH